MLRPQIFTCTIDSPRLASAHSKWGVVPPPKKKLILKIKIGPNIQPVRRNNFRFSGSIFTGLLSVDVSRGRSDKMGTICTIPTPKICDGQKIVQNFSRFLTTFDFDREYLRKRSTYQKWEKLLIIYNPSHVWRKKTWRTLVHKRKSY